MNLFHLEYRSWFIFNDCLTISINFITIILVIFFIFTVIRLDHPSYLVSNLIACHTCLSIGLMSFAVCSNMLYALSMDIEAQSSIDRFCSFRGYLINILSIYMNTSFCLKAINRLRCIVYSSSPLFRSYKSLIILMLIQLVLLVILSIPIVLIDAVNYDSGSNLCLITMNKRAPLFFLSKLREFDVDFLIRSFSMTLEFDRLLFKLEND